jgi:hypothetical protein
MLPFVVGIVCVLNWLVLPLERTPPVGRCNHHHMPNGTIVERGWGNTLFYDFEALVADPRW